MDRPMSIPTTPLPLLSHLDLALMADAIIDFCKVLWSSVKALLSQVITVQTSQADSDCHNIQSGDFDYVRQFKRRNSFQVDSSIPGIANHMEWMPHLDSCFSLQEINISTGWWHGPRPSWLLTSGGYQHCCWLPLWPEYCSSGSLILCT